MPSTECNASSNSPCVIVSLNPDGVVTAKPYYDEISVEMKTEAKKKLVS